MTTWETMDRAWEIVQTKTLLRWTNMRLEPKGLAIEDFETGFANGIALSALVDVLFDIKLTRKLRPSKNRILKLSNLQMIFEKQLKLIPGLRLYLDPMNLIDGNVKLILGFIWQLILLAEVSEITVEERSAKEGLLLWCQKLTKGYKGVDITNFTSCWQSGLSFAALIHRYSPSLICYEEVYQESLGDQEKSGEELEQARIVRLAKIFDIADTLGITKLIDAEDLAATADERSTITYLSMWFKAFGNIKSQEVAGRRVATLLSCARRHSELSEGFVGGSHTLLALVEQARTVIDTEVVRDLATVEETRDLVLATETGSSETGGLPRITQELANVTAALRRLQMQLRTDGRAEYVPAEGQSPDELTAVVEELQAAFAARRTELIQLVNDIMAVSKAQQRLDAGLQPLMRWAATAAPLLERDHPATIAATRAALLQLRPFADKAHACLERIAAFSPVPDTILGHGDEEAAAAAQTAITEVTETLSGLPAALQAHQEGLEAHLKELEAAQAAQKEYASVLLAAAQAFRAALGLVGPCAASLDGIVTDVEAAEAAVEAAERTLFHNIDALVTAHLDAIAEAGSALSEEHKTSNPFEITTETELESLKGRLLAAREEGLNRVRARFEEIQTRASKHAQLAEACRLLDVDLAAVKGAGEEALAMEASEGLAATIELSEETVTFQEHITAIREIVDQLGDAEAVGKLNAAEVSVNALETGLKQQAQALATRVEAAKVEADRLALQAAMAEREERCSSFAAQAQQLVAEYEVHRQEGVGLADVGETVEELETAHEKMTALSSSVEEWIETSLNPAVVTVQELVDGEYPVSDFTPLTAEQLTHYAEALREVITAGSEVVAEALEAAQAKQTRLSVIHEELADISVRIDAIDAKVTAAVQNADVSLEEQITAWRDAETGLSDIQEACGAAVTSAAGLVEESLLAYQLSARAGSLAAQISGSVATLQAKQLSSSLGEVSEEQLQEWGTLFEHFDSDQSGSLEQHEVSALLTSIGEDVSEDELTAVAESCGGSISFEDFCKFLQSRLKDTDTKEQVLEAFQELAGGNAGVTLAQLEAAGVTGGDLEFAMTLPVVEGEGEEALYDFNALVEQMF
eukprot:gnl/Dysnectes_brevis/1638_a1864_1016.p1 GENE.gnl/Dysnectes_brevis/1638_a1864_1016~~gnl/Dysnectes_brevis/1638_a1864_1016.p1  ORF type:complete len:1113 (-),score=503.44 gnl/Dysnectes_brevis/1638_a1864_1016:37-3339(-)